MKSTVNPVEGFRCAYTNGVLDSSIFVVRVVQKYNIASKEGERTRNLFVQNPRPYKEA
jgi:hypothetical protein